jgi:hypothetical protein
MAISSRARARSRAPAAAASAVTPTHGNAPQYCGSYVSFTILENAFTATNLRLAACPAQASHGGRTGVARLRSLRRAARAVRFEHGVLFDAFDKRRPRAMWSLHSVARRVDLRRLGNAGGGAVPGIDACVGRTPARKLRVAKVIDGFGPEASNGVPLLKPIALRSVRRPAGNLLGELGPLLSMLRRPKTRHVQESAQCP